VLLAWEPCSTTAVNACWFTIGMAHRQRRAEAGGHVAIARQSPVHIPAGVELEHVARPQAGTVGDAARRHRGDLPGMAPDPESLALEVGLSQIQQLQHRPVSGQQEEVLGPPAPCGYLPKAVTRAGCRYCTAASNLRR